MSAQSCKPSEPQDRHLEGRVDLIRQFLRTQRSAGGTAHAGSSPDALQCSDRPTTPSNPLGSGIFSSPPAEPCSPSWSELPLA